MVQKNWFILIAALAGGLVGAATVSSLSSNSNFIGSSPTPTRLVTSTGTLVGTPSFVEASANVLPTVVHIKNSRSETYVDPFYFDPFDFFGGGNGLRQQKRDASSTGSGVIISTDGYIVTNNHVVQGAEKLEVTLDDKRVLEAQVIGTDPNTDLALIKVSASNLLACPWGNSDDVQVGEWALAVGNPFNLNSTVTAGIISAKGRDINILNGQSKIESFLQTDAAVNPGNSGGALVNMKGELIGINTAIASRNGVYEGYAFAVPANLVKKIVEDLKDFGSVKRGYLGITVADINDKLAQDENLKVRQGAYVGGFSDNSPAREAGIKKGDVIVKIDGKGVKNRPTMMEMVSRKRPGEEIEVTVNRDGIEKNYTVKLMDETGASSLASSSEKVESSSELGATFSGINSDDKEKLGINGGVKIVSITGGKLKMSGIKPGFIITKIQNQKVSEVKDIDRILTNTKSESALLIEGVYPDGRRAYYGIGR
jgi:Do/DeqQ family serine protease